MNQGAFKDYLHGCIQKIEYLNKFIKNDPSNGLGYNNHGVLGIYNSTGTLVFNQGVSSNEALGLNFLEPGAYFSILESESKTYHQKLVLIK